MIFPRKSGQQVKTKAKAAHPVGRYLVCIGFMAGKEKSMVPFFEGF
jgi:hypothetical protein